MWAFDVIELNGDDLRHDPLEVRKETLAILLSRAAAGIRLNEHLALKIARLSSIMPASLALKASCRSAKTRATVPAARRIGSRARTRTRQR